VVLRQVDVGEADRIVSLLTASRGRLDVRVPGVRRSRKRFGGLDLYVRAEVELALGRGKPRLSGMRLVDDHVGIRGDVERLALAGYAAELLLQSVAEDQESDQAFRLACSAFQSLDGAAPGAAGGQGWARAFELKLLHVLGNRPILRRCASCDGPLEPDRLAWSLRSGGVLSGDCREEDPVSSRIAPGLAQQLDQALRLPLARQAELVWSRRDQDEARHVMTHFVAEHVGTRDRARRFLEQVLTPITTFGLAPLLGGLLLLFVGPVACIPADEDPTVRVQGYLYDNAEPLEGQEPIAGAEVTAWADDGRPLGEGAEHSSYPGFYRVAELPPEVAVHLEFESPDDAWMSTVLSGRTASDDLWVDPGVFHLLPRTAYETLVDAWAEALEPDPALKTSWAVTQEPGLSGTVLGTLVAPDDHLGLRLSFIDSEGVARAALYTDAEGLPSLAAGITEDGGFAVFGLAPGPVEVLLTQPDGTSSGRSFVTRSSEEGVTSLLNFEVL